MKRKWKSLLLLVVPFVAFAAWILINSTRDVPIEIIGYRVSDAEAIKIASTARHRLRKLIFSDFRWAHIKTMPRQWKNYSSLKLITIDPAGARFSDGKSADVTVYLWFETNGLQHGTSLPGAKLPRWIRADSDVTNLVPLSFTNAFTLFFSETSNGWEPVW